LDGDDVTGRGHGVAAVTGGGRRGRDGPARPPSATAAADSTPQFPAARLLVSDRGGDRHRSAPSRSLASRRVITLGKRRSSVAKCGFTHEILRSSSTVAGGGACPLVRNDVLVTRGCETE